MELTGSSAIVTGGASGIGAACARQLAVRGATVVVADLQADKGEALAAEINGVFAQVDVTNTEQIAGAVKAAAEIAPIRAVVNSAGIGWAQRTIGRDGTVESAHSLEAFTKVIQINLIGTFDMVRQAATAMSLNEPDADGCRGAIVNLASVAAFDGQIGQASYSASKGGVVGMTLPVARDLSASGIRLNTVAPGLIEHLTVGGHRVRRLAHPIYGEVIRAGLPPTASRAIRKRLADAASDLRETTAVDVLQVAIGDTGECQLRVAACPVAADAAGFRAGPCPAQLAGTQGETCTGSVDLHLEGTALASNGTAVTSLELRTTLNDWPVVLQRRACGLGFELAAIVPLLRLARRARRRRR